ncbi:helix-turn-helix domain-containing protein [Victivallis vadensis]|uniref:helix-turn-helix domain-containing protein n=1 Tax=Victivallis vadensis TaxID=172901 RepID=UPI00307DB174
MQEIETILDGLADLTGAMVLWKQANGSGCGFSARHTFHECVFCRAVKADPARLALCSRNDSLLLAEEAEKRGGPFPHRCHAGAVELIVPLAEGGRCRELLFAGIFREAADGTPYPELEAEFAALPFATGLPLDTLERMLSALAAIRRRPGEKCAVRELARRACLSESRFLHLFRREIGLPVSEFLLRERIREAKRLLRETGLPLLRVALECGFHDQSHFSGRFRRETGLTPLAYRREFGRALDI